MSFTQFVKPYPDGYENGEIGNTPVTAEILNTNYDGFLLALNSWASDIETDISNLNTAIGNIPSDIDDLSDVVISSPSDGQVLKYDNATGKWVNGAGGSGGASHLNDLLDVTVSNPSNSQILEYNSTTSKWENTNAPSIPDDLNDLTDVNVSNPSDGQFLKYDNTSGKWVNGSGGSSSVAALDDLTDVDISTPTDGQVLTYDDTNDEWINSNLPSIPSDIDDLSDVDISSPSDGQILKYDNTSQKWVNSTPSGGGHTIENDTGTSLTQRSALQFKGTYVHDDSTNNASIVEVTRKMTKSQFNQLSADEKKGIIVITDEAEPSGTSWVDVTGTLSAGSTSITLSDASITTDSTVDIYTDTFGVNPTAIVLATGSITLTFAAQQSAVAVKARITVNNGGYTDISGTLAAGSTSITLSGDCITTSSTIDIYTDGDVDYNSVTVATGSVTITFDEQESSLGVKVRVS